MSTWAIGDVQGCFEPLMALLEKIHFDPSRDGLWFTGDLVNRGPESLATLRYVKSLGQAAKTVLGNHDLHLLAIANGHQALRASDSIKDILEAPDREELLAWLRNRPLAIHDADIDCLLVHAGVAKDWSLADTLARADEVEAVLRADDHDTLLAGMYGNQPDQWSDRLQGLDRLRFIINAFTRMRYVDAAGRLDLSEKGAPGTQPPGLMPWFAVPGRKTENQRIVFGHWSTLGDSGHPRSIGIDRGCLWGGQLTALRLDASPQITCVNCRQQQQPDLEKKPA